MWENRSTTSGGNVMARKYEKVKELLPVVEQLQAQGDV